MHARDATGRSVSLLNDESAYTSPKAAPERLSYRVANNVISQPYRGSLNRAISSATTPELSRAKSYDSQFSNDASTPLTPSTMYADYGINGTAYSLERSAYDDSNSAYPDPTLLHTSSGLPPLPQKPLQTSYLDSPPNMMYEDDVDMGMASPQSATSPGALSLDRPGKRYPCRFRESHGCEKTFTTSGHASRHSKIHTAEKAVHCTFPSCNKKFTRADNMKQHLETHTKKGPRSSGAAGSSRPSLSGSRRGSTSARSTASGSGKRHSFLASAVTTPTLPPPGVAAWDVGSMSLPLPTRPVLPSRISSGLDALAMVAAREDA